jgi:hypothetical protein
MKQAPKIGTAVEYRKGSRHCSGVVVAIYPGGEEHEDEETGERWVSETHIAIKVDAPLPAWWPYLGTDRFAPPISEIK